MKRQPRMLAALVVVGPIALLLTACGGGEATATPVPPAPTPAATATPRPASTSAQATATSAATRGPAPTATATPRPVAAPTATPIPVAGVPTPVVLPAGKRGGALTLFAVPNSPRAWDTVDIAGQVDFHVLGPMLNNLLWPDPYGDGHTLVGDAAEKWEIGEDGKSITFHLRKGIVFHDGTPFTARDVAYNLDRGWKPRSRTMTYMQVRLQALEKIETLDDFTVRLTLSRPSNSFLRSLSINQFLMYPSHLPFPEKLDNWKRQPVGTGPFKFRSIDKDIKVEFVRNAAYFKRGLPYVDGIVYINLTNEAAGAVYRAGKLDASNFDSSILRLIKDQLIRDHGWIPWNFVISLNPLAFNQKHPWTEPRVREAVDLALDRRQVVAVWLQGDGTHLAPPMLPPENGGLWGISAKVMESTPGYRANRAADLARAKQLLAEAGIDPSKFTMTILANTTYPEYAQVVERNMAALGFKARAEIVPPPDQTSRLIRGDFDVHLPSAQIQFDDPLDYLAPQISTGAALNYGKWSNPEVDRLLTEQDRTLDVAKRRELITKLQGVILTDRFVLPVVFRFNPGGHMPWVKNYPKLPFQFGSWYRWEQVWLER